MKRIKISLLIAVLLTLQPARAMNAIPVRKNSEWSIQYYQYGKTEQMNGTNLQNIIAEIKPPLDFLDQSKNTQIEQILNDCSIEQIHTAASRYRADKLVLIGNNLDKQEIINCIWKSTSNPAKIVLTENTIFSRRRLEFEQFAHKHPFCSFIPFARIAHFLANGAKKEYCHGLDTANKDLPIAFIASKDNPEVSVDHSRNAYMWFKKNGFKNVYLLEVDNAATEFPITNHSKQNTALVDKRFKKEHPQPTDTPNSDRALIVQKIDYERNWAYQIPLQDLFMKHGILYYNPDNTYSSSKLTACQPSIKEVCVRMGIEWRNIIDCATACGILAGTGYWWYHKWFKS